MPPRNRIVDNYSLPGFCSVAYFKECLTRLWATRRAAFPGKARGSYRQMNLLVSIYDERYKKMIFHSFLVALKNNNLVCLGGNKLLKKFLEQLKRGVPIRWDEPGAIREDPERRPLPFPLRRHDTCDPPARRKPPYTWSN